MAQMVAEEIASIELGWNSPSLTQAIYEVVKKKKKSEDMHPGPRIGLNLGPPECVDTLQPVIG